MIDCVGSGLLVTHADTAHATQDLPPRVLLRTTATERQDWATFTAIADELIDFLATKNVVLIGIDTPSLNLATSQGLPSHHPMLAHDLRVLENLVLDDVPEGECELIALP